MRVWKTEAEAPAAVQPREIIPSHPSFPGGPPAPATGPSLPGNQVQLSVMQVYRITMQSVLRASGCTPRKLNPDEPWSWLLGQLIAAHRIPAPSVHLCWLQWYLQPDIRSLLPEALELVRNKIDVLRGAHLDGFERTQLDALRLDVRNALPHSTWQRLPDPGLPASLPVACLCFLHVRMLLSIRPFPSKAFLTRNITGRCRRVIVVCDCAPSASAAIFKAHHLPVMIAHCLHAYPAAPQTHVWLAH